MDGATLPEVEQRSILIAGRIAEIASLLDDAIKTVMSAKADHKHMFLTEHVKVCAEHPDWTVGRKKSWAELQAFEQFEALELADVNVKVLRAESSALSKALDLNRTLMATLRQSQPERPF